jgi:tRNA threonylcarbamoyl adenosine modification protein YeaZ
MSFTLLALDTALGETGIAVLREGKVAARFHAAERGTQAAMLRHWIEATLAEAEIGYEALERIVVNIGPGGFTSIRIGVAAARAIGFAAGIPVSGYTTLRLMAWGGRGENTASLALLPAGRGLLYAQRFGADSAPLGEARMEPVERALALAGEGDALVATDPARALLPEEWAARARAHTVARNAELLVRMALEGVEWDAPSAPAPLYIRPPDAGAQAPIVP